MLSPPTLPLTRGITMRAPDKNGKPSILIIIPLISNTGILKKRHKSNVFYGISRIDWKLVFGYFILHILSFSTSNA